MRQKAAICGASQAANGYLYHTVRMSDPQNKVLAKMMSPSYEIITIKISRYHQVIEFLLIKAN